MYTKWMVKTMQICKISTTGEINVIIENINTYPLFSNMCKIVCLSDTPVFLKDPYSIFFTHFNKIK